MRKRVAVMCGLVIAWGALLGAQAAYLAFEQVVVANTAIGFTSSKISPLGVQPTSASCRLETAEIRFTYDGTTPTTTVGTLLEVGDTLTVVGHDSLVRFLAIRTGANSGQLDCTYAR